MVSLLLGTTRKGYEYKYGGQHCYKRITTHAYLVLSFTQVSVDTLGPFADRPAAASRGGGTGGLAGGRTRGRSGDQGDGRIDGQGRQVGGQGSEVNNGVNGVPDFSTIIAHQLQNLLPTIVAQVGDQGRGQGNGKNQNGNAVIDNIRGDISRGCTYKEFLPCNPKEYDGKGGMSWEDFKTLTREEFCPSNEMQKLETKLWNHAMVGAGHAAYTDRFRELARLVPHLVTPEATEPKTIQKAMQIADTLTDEALRNGSIKKNHEKRGNRGEPSKDRNVRDDNKRTRARNAFAITANPVRGGYTGTAPKACYECGSTDYVKAACPRLNQAQRPWGNPQNQLMAVSVGQGCGNQGNQVRGRAFMLGAKEARQDPNIMTGAFTLNDHYATTLFDSDADYIFVSTTFIPLLDIELVI
ncbi:putative reverse transcriptase domain-containing protein [Tanacetum coccineum]|uniref:Reverse transcriptase domain-containing protein n=1 Tax=Tanacetum coccineum TaxID=301880 RepID=A0ABQ4ZEZ4_9ASTR